MKSSRKSVPPPSARSSFCDPGPSSGWAPGARPATLSTGLAEGSGRASPCRPELRMAAGEPARTDNGNLVLDTSFGVVDAGLGMALHGIPGVIEHGLFFGMAKAAIIGLAAGIRVIGEL